MNCLEHTDCMGFTSSIT